MDPTMPKYSHPYFQRMSTSFILLFEKIPFSLKDYFFGHLPDMVTVALLLCYSQSFHKSKNKIDAQFRHMIMDLVTEWTTGFRNSQKLPPDHWVMQYDLQEGGKLTQSAMNTLKGGGVSGVGGEGGGGGDGAPGTPGTRARTAKQKMLANLGASNGGNPEDGAGVPYARPIRLDHTLMHSPFMTQYLKQFGEQLDNKHLSVRLGLTFTPHRPVRTFDNMKGREKAAWHAERAIETGAGKELALARSVERNAEKARGELLKNYRANRKEFKKTIKETKDWEEKVVQELSSQYRGLARSDRTEFANVLVCKSLEEKKGKSGMLGKSVSMGGEGGVV
jgi:hypothetical protein